MNEAAFDIPTFNARVDQLDQLTTSQFLALRSLSNQLQQHVKEKMEAQRELKNIDKQPAMNVCQPGAYSGEPVAMNCAAQILPAGY